MARTAMKPTRLHNSAKPALELIEEATHVLRSAPVETVATYYAGTIPFVLAFLYFWTDMSVSPYANQHLAEASLATAALFFWMKFCQALFARRLRAQLAADRVAQHSMPEHARILFQQAVIQPLGLFMLPLALVLAVPFGWVYAFYQNVTALASPEFSSVSDLVRKAWKQTLVEPLQNHVILGIAVLFGTFVYLNWIIVTFSIPSLLKTFFGIESVFSKSPMTMFNTTLLASLFCLTYLTIDPLLKTIYVLRCFYGESKESGEDLRADLKRISNPLRRFAAVAMLSTADLDRRIDTVIHGNKYAWRLPRGPVQPDRDNGMIARFFRATGSMIRSVLRTVVSWLDRFFRELFRQSNGRGPLGFSWSSSSLLLYGLLAAVLIALAVFIYRIQRKKDSAPVVAEAMPVRPVNIYDESVSADQLPEDGWITMARDLLDRGELRLAIRAFYLASLAHLGQCNLISIARFKSNRDYENELRRRSHAIPELLPVFGAIVSTLERTWYGRHDADDAVVRQFASNVDIIRAVR
jgi:hypothetical protein